ncbi:glycosyltransferase [Inhella sp.]|uniref:glycosyltransferase n=1 Tax=Inhella sp. TaxID=1921806 RepID=UPI0035AF7C6D
MSRFLLHAPNVHVGGGAVLLRALLQAWPADQSLHAWLDERARGQLPLPPLAQVEWVQPRVRSRLGAERSLQATAQPGDRLLCFHGLPPLWPSRARVAVFVQNRLLLGAMSLQGFGPRTRLRLRVERLMARRLRGHVQDYWVQTRSMAEALQLWWGAGPVPSVHVLGFSAPAQAVTSNEPSGSGARHDFVYVADGEAHKNHRRLVEAWALLAADGMRPSLALTLGERDAALAGWVHERAESQGLAIELLPRLSHAEVLALYRRAGALIFPSLGESYGLPLIEAAQAGLPILAAEADFVRDVCVPAQCFDPHSPRSIARAVRRHLGQPEAPGAPATAADFLAALQAS